MPSASDTAYPRLKTNPSAKELDEIYAPNIFELVFAAEHARKPALQVGLLLLLKTFQRLFLTSPALQATKTYPRDWKAMTQVLPAADT
jgi:hypothetical protein